MRSKLLTSQNSIIIRMSERPHFVNTGLSLLPIVTKRCIKLSCVEKKLCFKRKQ